MSVGSYIKAHGQYGIVVARTWSLSGAPTKLKVAWALGGSATVSLDDCTPASREEYRNARDNA